MDCGSDRIGKSVAFDYSAVEMVIDHIIHGASNIDAIIASPGYKHILEHSKMYSSEPLTEENLRNSLLHSPDCFDFTHVQERLDEYMSIMAHFKEHDQDIVAEYASLPLAYLPDNYEQTAIVYFVIGGYNGIAFDNKICMNIDHPAFRANMREIEMYLAHELFHIGFEKYQALPDIFDAQTVRDLKEIVLSMTMNEGLATLTPLQKRLELNELDDADYRVITNRILLKERIAQFNEVIAFMDDNLGKELTGSILGNVLGQCSGGRLFYTVGCHIGRTIERSIGCETIKELVKMGHGKYFETYYGIIENN